MNIHFIGIGGIGLSALAKLMLTQGHTISGSDMVSTKITQGLEKLGIHISIPHTSEAIMNQDIIIYSAAVQGNNVELIEAQKRGLTILTRKEAIEKILKDKKVYSVCGAHGKSTTTAMLAAIMGSSTLVGAEAKEFGSNCRALNDSLMVFEADESDGSFLSSNPHCAIVTNCEPEHMEFYNYDYDKFYEAYTHFLNIATIRVINAEDPFLSTYPHDAIRLYPNRDITIHEYTLLNNQPTTRFTLKDIGEFNVWGFGLHYCIDASLAILAALHEKSLQEIQIGLLKFQGNKKRFDILTATNNFALIDDYGHHPTEIEATLESAKFYAKLAGLNSITAIWQPHKWSRTLDNLEHFRRCFEGVDRLIILPVWKVNEEDREFNWHELFGHYNLSLISSIKRLNDSIILVDTQEILQEGLIIGFGAGDITYQLRGEK